MRLTLLILPSWDYSFLGRLCYSLLRQTNQNYEIIFTDSRMNPPKPDCLPHAGFLPEDQSLSSLRDYLAKAAYGTHFLLLTPEDTLYPDAVETILAQAEEGTDLSLFPAASVGEKRTLTITEKTPLCVIRRDLLLDVLAHLSPQTMELLANQADVLKSYAKTISFCEQKAPICIRVLPKDTAEPSAKEPNSRRFGLGSYLRRLLHPGKPKVTPKKDTKEDRPS